jgi:hypothetical protein
MGHELNFLNINGLIGFSQPARACLCGMPAGMVWMNKDR